VRRKAFGPETERSTKLRRRFRKGLKFSSLTHSVVSRVPAVAKTHLKNRSSFAGVAEEKVLCHLREVYLSFTCSSTQSASGRVPGSCSGSAWLDGGVGT